MAYKVTLIPGDGIGPEITEATRKCVDATGVKIDWDLQECGIHVIEAEGKVPDRVLESIRATDAALKAPITTPIGKRVSLGQRVPASGTGALRVRPPV